MINKLILKQLENVKVANVSDYDKLKHTFHIKRFKEIDISLDKLYIVKLDKSLLNADANDLLVSNWNNGTYPKHQYLKFKATKKISKMIYVYGVYYDIDNDIDMSEEWIGWLPIEKLTIIREE